MVWAEFMARALRDRDSFDLDCVADRNAIRTAYHELGIPVGILWRYVPTSARELINLVYTESETIH